MLVEEREGMSIRYIHHCELIPFLVKVFVADQGVVHWMKIFRSVRGSVVYVYRKHLLVRRYYALSLYLDWSADVYFVVCTIFRWFRCVLTL